MTHDQEGKTSHPRTISLIVTILAHIFLLVPVIYIIAVYSDTYSFFSWHPICMAIGAGLLINEGIFVISGEANLTNRLSRANRITTHWILNTCGLTLVFIGLIIIIVHKNNIGRSHFQTTHGQLGLSSIVIACVIASGGILANNTRWFYPRIRPIYIKVGHALGGIAMMILFIATIINGTYKYHFPGGYTGRTIIFVFLFFAAVIILFKPIIGAISRVSVILKPSQPAQSSS
ncbi:cytochrome b561 domain-containing protein 2-like [Chelonus insularis]|uniref:cytochrome b561 domain-containing protein 2-like n=1 Tax=Chelonus insularis TaxID=460826 RepID=UPI00158A90EE|nr:cytochrome b561 domain-containing protein 2-like [Chelonus insularis]XP_034942361.1 cytochrome b561 domain-containing protein 2-like [Chelonus insularis]XP_034942362.1 cytochrome b561 domain-containing protein 2-like [Chelonus insularis]